MSNKTNVRKNNGIMKNDNVRRKNVGYVIQLRNCHRYKLSFQGDAHINPKVVGLSSSEPLPREECDLC